MIRKVTRVFLFLALASLASLAVSDEVEGPVNINSAEASALASGLSGVGEARAQAIVEYREANGDFSSADELAEVSGIGDATVEANRDRIVVD